LYPEHQDVSDTIEKIASRSGYRFWLGKVRLEGRYKVTSIYPPCIPKGMSHPQERIAQRLGMERETVSKHLVKTSELKNLPNDLLRKGFLPNTIAEKLDWRGR